MNFFKRLSLESNLMGMSVVAFTSKGINNYKWVGNVKDFRTDDVLGRCAVVKIVHREDKAYTGWDADMGEFLIPIQSRFLHKMSFYLYFYYL